MIARPTMIEVKQGSYLSQAEDKELKEICADLKKIYGAVNLDHAEYAKEEFREKWDKKYPSIMRSWDANWVELTTFFNYPEQIRQAYSQIMIFFADRFAA